MVTQDENSRCNTVELLGYYGGDKTHAMSAWTSTTRDYENKKHRMPKLLKETLAPKGHKTPFEKSMLHFLVTTDIATHIHIIKHRIGVSVNAESARYKELKEDKYFLPDDWKDAECSTPIYTPFSGVPFVYKGTAWLHALERYTKLGNKLYHAALKDLEPHIGRKRAKESSRYFKNYNSQITADVAFNFSSFVHFLGLRNSPKAQKEVREVAEKMLQAVQNIPGNPFKESLEAYGYGKKYPECEYEMDEKGSFGPAYSCWMKQKEVDKKPLGELGEKLREFDNTRKSEMQKKLDDLAKKMNDSTVEIQGHEDMIKEVQDLKKAIEYLQRKIDFLEKK